MAIVYGLFAGTTMILVVGLIAQVVSDLVE